MEAFKELVELKEAYQKKVKTEGEKILKVALQEAFIKHPEIKAIRWAQFTPYFNDGEPCIFGINSVYIKLDKESLEGDNEDGFVNDWDLRKSNPVLCTFIKSLEKDLDTILDCLQSVFGDHSEVTVTPEGITIEEYEHD